MPFYWGTHLNGNQANSNGKYPYMTDMKGNYLAKTSKVGSYEKHVPHPWGLCDMIGNVSEWCNSTKSIENQLFQPKVIRGGSWIDYCDTCRTACRNNQYNQDFTLPTIGFRVLIDPN
jgi:formylglycine-generating enzyme